MPSILPRPRPIGRTPAIVNYRRAMCRTSEEVRHYDDQIGADRKTNQQTGLLEKKCSIDIVARTGEWYERRIEHLQIRRTCHCAGWSGETEEAWVDELQWNSWFAGPQSAQVHHAVGLGVEQIDYGSGSGACASARPLPSVLSSSLIRSQ